MSVKILNNDLKSGEFSSLYYIYGEEEYLKEFYFSSLKSKAVTQLPEFNIIEFDNKSFNYLDFTNAVNSYPMMSDKKLVSVINFDNSLLKKDFTKQFVEFLRNIPEFCVVVFFDTSVKETTSSNALEKAVNSADGVSVFVQKPDTSSLVSWVARHLKSYNKTASKEDILYLLDISDTDMLTLLGEISKLCNYVENDVITKDDINKLVTRSIETNRYGIAEAFCKKDYSKIFDILDKLYKQCVDDIVIANIFYRAFVDLWKAKLAYKKGKSAADFARDFKLNSYAATKIYKNLKYVSEKTLENAVLLALKLDADIKSTPFDKRGLIVAFVGELVSRRDLHG